MDAAAGLYLRLLVAPLLRAIDTIKSGEPQPVGV
jgi:hypothetical protein